MISSSFHNPDKTNDNLVAQKFNEYSCLIHLKQLHYFQEN